MIRRFRSILREYRARRRLQQIVEDTRGSFRCQLYRKNREAQLRRRPAHQSRGER